MTGVWTYPTLAAAPQPAPPMGRDYIPVRRDEEVAGGPHPPSGWRMWGAVLGHGPSARSPPSACTSRAASPRTASPSTSPPPLDFFQLIVPCGLTKPVTSIEFETGLRPSLDEVMTIASRTFGELFHSQMLWLESIHDLIPENVSRRSPAPPPQDTPARAPENERRIAPMTSISPKAASRGVSFRAPRTRIVTSRAPEALATSPCRPRTLRLHCPLQPLLRPFLSAIMKLHAHSASAHQRRRARVRPPPRDRARLLPERAWPPGGGRACAHHGRRVDRAPAATHRRGACLLPRRRTLRLRRPHRSQPARAPRPHQLEPPWKPPNCATPSSSSIVPPSGAKPPPIPRRR